MGITENKQLRILYAAGPGDVIGTFRYWMTGKEDPSQVAATYSGQFFDVCAQLNAEAYVISRHEKKALMQYGPFLIEHRPTFFTNSSGLFYHLGQVLYGFWLIKQAIRFQANVFVCAEGTTYWFILSLLSWFGIHVVPTIHCTLWSKFLPKSKTERVLLRLSRGFFSNDCTAILSASDDITLQVNWLTKGRHAQIVPFLPTYQRQQFANLVPASSSNDRFRILYVGRIEEEKGVFDLLSIAERFAKVGRTDITFDLCGNGSDLETLRAAAKVRGLQASFVCYGHCNKTEMREMFNRAHVVIVPTRTTFNEGFNQVVVEAVLSGRPVITSSVCPSASLVKEAVVEVMPDDVNAYAEAILNLCDNKQLYEEKRRNCSKVDACFYDPTYGWSSSLKTVLNGILSTGNLREELTQSIEEKTLVTSVMPQ